MRRAEYHVPRPISCFLLATLLASNAAGAALELREIAATAGVTRTMVCGSHEAKRLILEENGSGAALFDYDGDGDLDIYLANGSDVEILAGNQPPVQNALYRNDGSWHFIDVTETAGVAAPGWSLGVAVGDIDGDHDLDLYVTHYGANILFENLGDGRFRDVSAEAGVADEGWGHSAAFGDTDNDGDLDLYVANYLEIDWRAPPNDGRLCPYKSLFVACGPVGFPKQRDRLFANDGNGRFRDVSVTSGIHEVDPEFGLGVTLGDIDDDGWLDIYVANDSGPNFLFQNRGDGRFEEIAWFSGVATQAEGRFQAGMGVVLGDANGDLLPDIIVTNYADDHNTFYRNQGDLMFSDESYPSGLGGPSRISMGWGMAFADLDHDGDLDLYVANGHIYPEVEGIGSDRFPQPDHLYLNDGSGRFTSAQELILGPSAAKVSRGVTSGDIDFDGDLDLLVVTMGSSPLLYRNDGDKGHFLLAELRGKNHNTAGLGAVLLLTAGDRTQRREAHTAGSYCSAKDPRPHFGLRSATKIEQLEIRWPSGSRQRFVQLPIDHTIILFEAG